MIGHIRAACKPTPPGAVSRPGEVRLDGLAKEAMDTGRNRLVLTGVLFALAFGTVGIRLVDVSLVRAARPADTAQNRLTNSTPDGDVRRADVVDRNGVVLATTLTTYSLYADPKWIADPAAVARRLRGVLPGMDRADLIARLKTKRRFIWLRRHMTPRQYQAVIGLGLPGIHARKDGRRIYPHGRLASHVVGFTDVDNRGLAGVEQYFDDSLRRGVEKLRLSLDIRVQHVLREELSTALRTYRGIGASGLILDIKSGEIVAMVSLPDFDPNDPMATGKQTRFNRNTLGVYEMGSTFKVFNTALALESRIATMKARFDASKPLKISRFTIRDYHGKGRWLSVPEIFVHSSNIGSARMAMKAGGERQRRFLGRLGLLRAPKIELAEVAAPMVPSPWRKINTVTISFGHGIAVTPLQMAVAVAGITNKGIMVPPTLVRRPDRQRAQGRRVVGARTSAQLRRLMRMVVERGTGRKADAVGYRVGGKTGTADKPGLRGYSRKRLISSFVAAFPIDRPRFLVLAMVDEPKGTKETHGYATGGWVAAPIVRNVVARSAPLLGVRPVMERGPVMEYAERTPPARTKTRSKAARAERRIANF